ncbi:hypothetical protein [Heyndrickxia vini]|uniref:Uncharacterized protein n=1 Tax=Heyndrickxia vini TaxID=1476025 RepID=A0ABX7E4R3_9BACI|nr:hypothetical protein [Heyndrickxia vini]QQZ10457.1 hypothetical protein I5776_05870 [Heyndrickxia vini]
MAYLDPGLMRVFRGRIANPMTLRRVYGICRSYRLHDLRRPAGAYGMVDRLSRCVGVPVTPAQRHNAAQWLMTCGVDPQHPGHRRRMWRMIRGGW